MSEATQVGLAMVAKVLDQDSVVINRGYEHGVKVGSKFLIFGFGDEVIDPESNQSLGNLELVRGIGSATHVQDKMSTVKSAKVRNPTPTIRTVKRNPRGAFGLIIPGGDDETIEERAGDPTTVPFDDVKVGDRARPL